MNFQFPTNIELLGTIALFLIFLALITWILRKTKLFEDSKGTMIVISASASVLTIYGLAKINFSISDIFYRLNLSEIIQYNILIILIIIGIILLWKRIGIGITLIVLGTLMLLVGILNLIYANASIGIIGAVLAVFGIWIYTKRKNKRTRLKNIN